MSDCRIDLSTFSLSPSKAAKRTAKAAGLLGKTVVHRILAYALYLLGAERREIASCVSMPLGTLFSFLTRIQRDGLPSLEDRRAGSSQFLPTARKQSHEATIRKQDGLIVLDLGMAHSLGIPQSNPLQAKVVLLSLAGCGILKSGAVAEVLEYTPDYVNRLCRQLQESDVGVLLEHRTGQQQDYRMTPQIKAELVQQAAAHALTGKSVSASALTRALNERLGVNLADRTVRLHMAKLGLSDLTKSLPQLVYTLKKTSQFDDGG